MNVQKRGLGRGLEALLVDVSHKETEPLNSTDLLVKAIQTENANLIQEAEALKSMLDDFETMVRNFNLDRSS
jgi:DNA anti-recombination protein RmuC